MFNVSFFSNSTSESLALQGATICDKINIQDFDETISKEVNIKTKHFVLKVKIFNQPNATFFGCSKWDALCKTYAFYDNMKIAFDLGHRRRGSNVFRDDKISMELGDMIPVRCSCEFVKQQFCYFYNLFFFAQNV